MAKLRPLKAIRKHCIECSGGSYKEAKLCNIDVCSLHEYRFGKRPVNSNDKDTASE